MTETDEQMEVTSITLPPDLKRWAKNHAYANGQSLSSFIAVLVAREKEAAKKRKR